MKTATSKLAAATACALAILSATAFAEDKVYVIKQSSPSLGSTINRPIVITGTIPLDKRYADLTPEQKSGLKSLYEKMGDNDEPPFPVNGLMPLYKGVAKMHEALEFEYKGPVTMYVQVDSAGNPGELYLVEAPDPQVGQMVANILSTQKFKPALCNGTPCSMRYVFHAELIGPEAQNHGTTAIQIQPKY